LYGARFCPILPAGNVCRGSARGQNGRNTKSEHPFKSEPLFKKLRVLSNRQHWGSQVVRPVKKLPLTEVKVTISMRLGESRKIVVFYVTCHRPVSQSCPRGQEISARFACGHAQTRPLL
jgi:hypothetical protein